MACAILDSLSRVMKYEPANYKFLPDIFSALAESQLQTGVMLIPQVENLRYEHDNSTY